MDRGERAGDLLRRYRQAAGLSQRQLAEAARISIGVVRDLEQGRTSRLRGQSVRALVKALGLDAVAAAELAHAAVGEATTADRPAAVGEPVPVSLRLCVLGPLAAWRDGVPVELGPPADRAVLGLLALSPGHMVHREVIIDALWGEAPPVSAVNQVQSSVSRLRNALDPERQAGAGGPVVSTGTGYLLSVTADQLDLLAFRHLAGDAEVARLAGEAVAACGLYQRALELWRGDPLADVEVLRQHPAVTDLALQRSAAILGYAETASGLGRSDRVLSVLLSLTQREPLHEKAHAALMIALAGAGRRDAALRVFEDVRRRLDEQLGVLPGTELADAHRRVLCGDVPAGDAQRPAAARGRRDDATVAARVVPRQLPMATSKFAGRKAELAELTALLGRTAGTGTVGTVVISAIAGTAGVGKTALALNWAHQMTEDFPDGQLYVNLRGYDPAQPVAASEALAGFLRALGMTGQDIPAEENERAAMYRSLLSGRRMLVMLDNAASAEQVRPLLPGAPRCLVLTTSRDSLAGLVVREGATRLELDVLPLADAVDLLRTLVGSRVDDDPAAAAALAERCCRLPLALRVAAEFAAARPSVPLASLAAELAGQRPRLDLLNAGGDPRSAVRAVFSWSCRYLDPDASSMFRRLGLHPGPDLDGYAAAALAGTTVEQADHLLRVLARAHLILSPAPGRWDMHDLLRDYAGELAAEQDAEAERRAALTRLLDYYLHTAAAAMDALYPSERHIRPCIPPPACPVPEVPEVPEVHQAARARAWLDAERACLVAAVAHAAGHGWPGHATRLAATVFRHLQVTGHYQEIDAICSDARRAAQATGDLVAEAEALNNLAAAAFQQGRYRQGAADLRRALGLYRQAEDGPGQARTLGNLGITEFKQGRYRRAAADLREALGLYRQTGDESGEARALNILGLVNSRLGDYEQAGECLTRAVALSRQTGLRDCEAYSLINLGLVELRLGRHQQADGRLREALTLSRQLGDLAGEAEALNGLGEVSLATGLALRARELHTTALGLTSQIGDQFEQARAYCGLASANHALGDTSQARGYWQQALVIYTRLGVPEAGQVRDRLTAG